MPSNTDLIAGIKALDADVKTEGLSNAKLAELLKELRVDPEAAAAEAAAAEAAAAEAAAAEAAAAEAAAAEAAAAEAAAAAAVGHTVAEGKAITSRRGVLEGGDEVIADDLGGGADALAALVKSGHVVAPK